MSHQGEQLKVQERWYEKLHNWEKALNSYEERLVENAHDIELILGQMRCMEALGEWLVFFIYMYFFMSLPDMKKINIWL